MAIGVILNRVFRLNNNPLFDYIYSNKESINQCYFIIPTEEFEEEAKSTILLWVHTEVYV